MRVRTTLFALAAAALVAPDAGALSSFSHLERVVAEGPALPSLKDLEAPGPSLAARPARGAWSKPRSGASAMAAALPDPAALISILPRALVEPPLAGLRPLVAPPAAESAGAPRAARGEQSALARHVELRLQPLPFAAPAAPGLRAGHGDVAFSLPLGSSFELRTGVRVDYDHRPDAEGTDLDSTPTFGFGLRF
jgi:hypothetical protein